MSTPHLRPLVGFVAVIMSVFFVAPPIASAEEVYGCYTDPVVSRNLTGRTTMGARVRSTACMTDNVVTTLPGNTLLTIIAETDGWYKIQSGDTTGWIGARLIRVTGETVAKTEVKPATEFTYSKPVGVSEKDFARLKAKNYALLKRLRNRIVMRVHDKGQQYYVESNGALRQIVKSATVVLPKETTNSGTVTTPSLGSITLNGVQDNGKAVLTWSLVGMGSPKGFKVVVSESPNPVYPGNDYHYLSSPDVRSDAWDTLAKGKTYYFRVCEYLGGACGVYSNNATVTLPADSSVSTTGNEQRVIILSTTLSGNTANLTWTLQGMTSPKGFKIVRSNTMNPVYPGNDYHYLSDPMQRTDSWPSLSSGTNHFRVCEYLGGACGVYSNDVTVNAP